MVWGQKKRRHSSLDGRTWGTGWTASRGPWRGQWTVLEEGFLSLCLLGLKCCQSAGKVSRNERCKAQAEEERPWDSTGGRSLGCDVRTGKGQESGDPRKAQLAQEMVIMEADTQPDTVPSSLHVFMFQ